jgi:hypothetical protein
VFDYPVLLCERYITERRLKLLYVFVYVHSFMHLNCVYIYIYSRTLDCEHNPF